MQRETETAPLPEFGFDPDFSVHALDGPPRDRQADAGPRIPAVPVQPLEDIEDLLMVFCVNPDAAMPRAARKPAPPAPTITTS